MKKWKRFWGIALAGIMAVSILCTAMTAFAEEAETEALTEAQTEADTSSETDDIGNFVWTTSMTVTFTDTENNVSYAIFLDANNNLILWKLSDNSNNPDAPEGALSTSYDGIVLGQLGTTDEDRLANLSEKGLNLYTVIAYYFNTIPQNFEEKGIW
ncbi:MAG: hypothetical protein LIP12_18190 [Clostridiales bacterium]|nr:hypothetical protein [Clostridiales bacterium]